MFFQAIQSEVHQPQLQLEQGLPQIIYFKQQTGVLTPSLGDLITGQSMIHSLADQYMPLSLKKHEALRHQSSLISYKQHH